MTPLYLAIITLVSGVTVTTTTSDCLVWSKKLERHQPQRISLETKWVTEILTIICTIGLCNVKK